MTDPISVYVNPGQKAKPWKVGECVGWGPSFPSPGG
jgi:hypothetical protein